jgi:hypothetical protein
MKCFRVPAIPALAVLGLGAISAGCEGLFGSARSPSGSSMPQRETPRVPPAEQTEPLQPGAAAWNANMAKEHGPYNPGEGMCRSYAQGYEDAKSGAFSRLASGPGQSLDSGAMSPEDGFYLSGFKAGGGKVAPPVSAAPEVPPAP